ncbi:MAG: hypothetical protein ACE367_19785 [Acidimicrobiales bacterium]
MADELERHVQSIDTEGPDPDAFDRMRRRIAAAEAEHRTSAPAVEGDVVELDVVDDTLRRRRRPPWPLFVAAAVVAIIAMAGLWATGDDPDSEQLETAGSPQAATADASPETPEGTAAPMDAEATPFADEFSPIDPGSYRIDSLGTQFTVRIPEALFVRNNLLGSFTLTDRVSQGPGDRDLLVARYSALSDPTQPTTPFAELDEPWPAADFEGWLDNLTDDVLVTNRQQTQIGGRAAIRVDLEIGDLDCGFFRLGCAQFATNNFVVYDAMNLGSRYRIWFIDQGDEDPIFIKAGVDDLIDTDWFDRIEDIVATVAFGDPTPNPILEYPAGPVELPFLGGIRIELSTPTVVFGGGAGGLADTTVLRSGRFGGTDLITNPSEPDGTPLTTTTELLSVLEASNVDIEATEPTSVGGLDAQTFDITGGLRVPALTFGASGEPGWLAPPQGRMWVVEHPERGLLIITAGGSTDPDTAYPTIVAQTEAIVDSLEFIDPS